MLFAVADRLPVRLRGPLFRLRRRLGDHRAFVLDLLPLDGVGMEVGVWKGDFSDALLREAAPRRLYLVDPWRFVDDGPLAGRAWYSGTAATSQSDMDDVADLVRSRFQEDVRRGVVEIHRSDSEQAVQAIADDPLDWAYIDGDHTYEGVASDLAAVAPVIRPGGLLILDDHTTEGWWGDGVVRAAREFLSSQDEWQVVADRHAQLVLLRCRCAGE